MKILEEVIIDPKGVGKLLKLCGKWQSMIKNEKQPTD